MDIRKKITLFQMLQSDPVSQGNQIYQKYLQIQQLIKNLI